MRIAPLALATVMMLPAAAPAAGPVPPAAESGAAHLQFKGPGWFARLRRIVVPVRIDGQGPFRFLLDTGADGSIISRSLVRRLKLTVSQSASAEVDGTTGVERMPYVTIARLKVGPIVKTGVIMPISDSPVLHGLDGILGMAGFGAVRLAVNFKHNRVVIDRADNVLWGYFDIPARRTPGGLLMIPARIGGIRVVAVIDTGSPSTLGNTALRKALIRRASHKGVLARIFGVTHQIDPGGRLPSPTIHLGPIEIRHLAIVYAKIPIFRIWHLQSRPAVIIGMNVLECLDSLVLDYPTAQVYMLPAAQPISGVPEEVDWQRDN